MSLNPEWELCQVVTVDGVCGRPLPKNSLSNWHRHMREHHPLKLHDLECPFDTTTYFWYPITKTDAPSVDTDRRQLSDEIQGLVIGCQTCHASFYLNTIQPTGYK